MKTVRDKECSWFVYIIEASSGRLYTGVTTDVSRRYKEHLAVYDQKGRKGAKFFRGDKPVSVVYQEACESKSLALKREYYIKTLSRARKQALICQ